MYLHIIKLHNFDPKLSIWIVLFKRKLEKTLSYIWHKRPTAVYDSISQNTCDAIRALFRLVGVRAKFLLKAKKSLSNILPTHITFFLCVWGKLTMEQVWHNPSWFVWLFSINQERIQTLEAHVEGSGCDMLVDLYDYFPLTRSGSRH